MKLDLISNSKSLHQGIIILNQDDLLLLGSKGNLFSEMGEAEVVIASFYLIIVDLISSVDFQEGLFVEKKGLKCLKYVKQPCTIKLQLRGKTETYQ